MSLMMLLYFESLRKYLLESLRKYLLEILRKVNTNYERNKIVLTG